MKANKPRVPVTLQIGIKYGAISAVLLCTLLVILYYADRHPLLIPVVYDVRILLIAIFSFFAIKEFRDNKNGGILHMWQGMLVGLMASIVLGFIAAIFILVFGTWDGNFLGSFISQMTDNLTNSRDQFLEAVGEEAYQNTLRNLPSTSLTDLAMDYYFKSVVIGLFLTIIISIILRRKPKTTENHG